MIRILGPRRSGKTTKLLSLAEEDGYVIVEPNATMTDYVRHMATEKGLNVNVISAHELLYRQRGIVREKYLVDELEMFLASLRIEGYSDGLEAQDKLLKEQEEETKFVYDEYLMPTCEKCGFQPFVGYIPTIKWMKERGYMKCPRCGRAVKWK